MRVARSRNSPLSLLAFALVPSCPRQADPKWAMPKPDLGPVMDGNNKPRLREWHEGN